VKGGARFTAGFMLTPLLYMLALAGVGATVMFSGYSQILKSNAEMTALNAARAQLQAAGQTLSATSVLDTATSSIVEPPAVLPFASVTGGDVARLPTGYADAGNSGTPTSPTRKQTMARNTTCSWVPARGRASSRAALIILPWASWRSRRLARATTQDRRSDLDNP
jgi:hypothetical protein